LKTSLEFITGVPVGTSEKTCWFVRSKFDIGAMFKAKLNNKLNVYSSLNYTLENTLTSQGT
jgi:hypothetical protein